MAGSEPWGRFVWQGVSLGAALEEKSKLWHLRR
jgi:hypothetical protein